MTLESIDRGLFELIRLALIKYNLLPDILNYNTISLYENAKVSLRNSRADRTIVELFGVGSPESREEKTDAKIIIDRKEIIINTSLGGFPEIKFEKKGTVPETYKKFIFPEACYDINYEVRIICTSTKMDRLLHNILFSSLGSKKYLKSMNTDNTFSKDKFLILYKGNVDLTAGNFIERIFRYSVDQVWIAEDTLLEDNIPTLVKINNTIKEVTEIKK